MCLARHNNHPTSLASSWDISFLRSLVQQDPKGSDKVANLFILDVYVSPNRKKVNLSLIYYILDISFFMSQDDAYFHIHQNDPFESVTSRYTRMVKDCRQVCGSNQQEILLVQQYKRFFVVQEYKNSHLLSKNIKGVSLLSKNTKGFIYCPRNKRQCFIREICFRKGGKLSSLKIHT